MPRNHAKCAKCGELKHLDLLDSKDDGSGNFTILECQGCYGPSWVPARVLKCAWYLACENAAIGNTSHPILKSVSICQRCADRHSLPVTKW